MVTIILAIAILVAVVGLGFEIGVASWNIRRASRYRRRMVVSEAVEKRAIEERREIADRLKDLDNYAKDISWLLNFLYKRYNKFSDLENEVEHGVKGLFDDATVEEADKRYKDLKKALKLVRVTVRASDRMENLMESISSQLSQIAEDFKKAEEEEAGEGKPESASETEFSESSAPEAQEGKQV